MASLSVAVHKDIGEYQEKVVGKLSLRTLLCVAGGLAASVATASALYAALGVEPVSPAGSRDGFTDRRLAEAARLGFTRAVIPRHGSEDVRLPAGMRVVRVDDVLGAIAAGHRMETIAESLRARA